MQPYYERSGIRLYHGDAADVLPTLEAESISAVVSDPPAGIAFMSKAWDRDKGGRDQWVAWLASILSECNRAMKPGAHAVIWALPRTSGWTHRAIEDAGLDVRDCVTHLFGSGFPKSHNLPGGLGTALKPAAEFWYLARKPLSGTVAANVLEHGTGALNIDASRVAVDPNDPVTRATFVRSSKPDFSPGDGRTMGDGWADAGKDAPMWSGKGRWPPNVILGCCGNDPHDADCAAALLDQMSGERPSRPGKNKSGAMTPGFSGGWGAGNNNSHYPDSDHLGASRFFPVLPIDDPDTLRFLYTPKASRRERNAGLDGLPESDALVNRNTVKQCANCDNKVTVHPGGALSCPCGDTRPVLVQVSQAPRANTHPTVKPLALMRWLLTLVTPPGGIVLDPFAGSGTTGVAAAQLGIPCVLIEQEVEYLPIIAGRIDHALDERAGAELPLFAGVAD